MHTTSPSLDEDWSLVWLVVVHFTCPTLLTLSSFHHSSQCFKNRTFLLHLSRQSHAEIGTRRVFFFFPLNLGGCQTTKQLTKPSWCQWFSTANLDILTMLAISQVVEHWLFSIKVSIWLLSISTGLPNHGASSFEKYPAWNFANYFWHLLSDTAHTFSIHCTNTFFHFSWVSTFVEILKHNMPKMLLFFLPSSIL